MVGSDVKTEKDGEMFVMLYYMKREKADCT